MRITQNMNFDAARASMNRTGTRLAKFQEQTSSLKKVNVPSDDPVNAAKILEMRTEKVNNDQFMLNSKMAKSYLENTDHVLADLADIILRAKEIAISQSSGASANENTRLGVSEEVKQLYLNAVATANRKVGDRYLMGGYQTNQPPVDAKGAYLGDEGRIMLEIAKGIFLTANVAGSEAFNTVEPRPSQEAKEDQQTVSVADGADPDQPIRHELLENVNVFDELQNLRIGLLTGDNSAIRGTLDRFDQVHSHLIAMRAKVGSRVSGIDSTERALERHNLTNADLSSSLEDADMAQVMSDMAQEETVYRSALQTSQRLLQPTLLEFLR